MSADVTPLERLEDAIRAYVGETKDGNPLMSAWVLVWQEQRIVSEDGLLPVQWNRDFMMGQATSPETAMGLMDLGSAALRSIMIGGDDE